MGKGIARSRIAEANSRRQMGEDEQGEFVRLHAQDHVLKYYDELCTLKKVSVGSVLPRLL